MNYKHDAPDRLGILLVNLGSPDEPTTPAVRRYLAEFLWDPRLVDIPRPLWWLILHGVILRIRPARSAEAYRQVWTEKGSPLIDISRRQTQGVTQQLASTLSDEFAIELAMRYGNPSIPDALEALKKAGMQRLLVLPLYPQFSSTTTASVFDAIAKAMQRWRWIPELRYITHYHDHPLYIEALANSIRQHWQENPPAEKLLFSFHGIPKRYFDEGDPYYCHCQKTARLVAEKLELADNRWQVVFQSRFGREEWLKPYCDETLKALPGQGVKSVDLVCPGFSADCLETLEEIDEENREYFLHAGGEQFSYIPALNDNEDHIKALCDVIIGHLKGWPEGNTEFDPQQRAAELKDSLERAQKMGAKT